MNEKNRNLYKLKELKIEVTYRCNLNCIHCSSDSSPNANLEMTKEQCLNIIQEAIDLGTNKIAFSGGEPLLWNGLESGIEKARDGGLEVVIYTTGNLGDFVNKLKFFYDMKISKIIFSVFGSVYQTHEKITRIIGSFQATIDAISATVGMGIKSELHFVPIDTNYRELEGIANLGKKLGSTSLSVLRFVPQGRGSLIEDRRLNKIQNLELKRSIEDLKERGFNIRTGSPFNVLLLNNQPRCMAGIDRLTIGPDLRIFPCDAFKQIKAEELVEKLKYSKIGSDRLKDCWEKSPFLNAVRKYLTTPFKEPCKSCKVLRKCLSGCLAQKVILFGDLEKRFDPDCLITNL